MRRDCDAAGGDFLDFNKKTIDARNSVTIHVAPRRRSSRER
jgi:hypothetical protein